MNAKHTAGPWENDDTRKVFKYAHVIRRNGLIIATIHQSSFDSTAQEFAANARLIAAAPKMYDALKAITGRAEGLLDGESDTQYLWDKLGPEYRQAMAAIAEVEGK